ncbi:MAG: DUF3078 domain-containing protein [Dysgonamonadaceae bacterium]|nr:DUF3078 domain-containing protein [Dysgonamonadaceae bacterium]
MYAQILIAYGDLPDEGIEQISLSPEDSIVLNRYLDFISKDKKQPTPNPYLLPPVFDGKFGFEVATLSLDNPYEKKSSVFPVLNERDSLPTEILGKTKFREKAYRDFLRNNMLSVKYTYKDFDKEAEKIEEIKPNFFKNLFAIDPEIELERSSIDQSTRFYPKKRYWKVSGSSLLQISQNYISDNWASGGIGSFSLLSIQNHTANYEKGKFRCNNFIEWKLSFYRNKNDSVPRVGEDLFRTYSDVNLKAFHNKWSYSANLELKTQLFAHSDGNPRYYKSDFFAPFQVNMGILGMKYETKSTSSKNKYQVVNFNVDISLFSLQSRWLFDDEIDPIRHGIEKGKNHTIDLGSTLNSKLTVNFNRQISFASRLKYFTNYEETLVESENELKMAFNQFFTTRLYLYARFDDSEDIKRDEKLGYLQLNQLLSFGFNFTW